MGKHKLLKLTLTSAAALYGINAWIDKTASNKNVLNETQGDFYHWKYGDIFYTVQGTGSPLLLIHNVDFLSSHDEWSKLVKKLSKEHQVYTLDLIGCGQSEKPNLTYTNYLYVQLVTDFVKEIIQCTPSVITSGDSSSFVIMANHMNPELFHQVILINPSDVEKTSMEPSRKNMIEKYILFSPLIGTTLYNYYTSEEHIRNIILQKYLYQTTGDFKKLIDTCYQSAHSDKSKGRFLYASKKCCYLNVNIAHALKDKTNLSIISGNERKNSIKISDGYTRINDKIDVTDLSHCKLLPQWELPDKTLSIINQYLK